MTILPTKALQIIALGDFATPLPTLAPRLKNLGITQLRAASFKQLPSILTSTDLLLCELGWLKKLTPAQSKKFSQYASNLAGWIVLLDDTAHFKDQVTWLRHGVSHFFKNPVESEHLARLIEDIHDLQFGPPIRVILLDDEASSLTYYTKVLCDGGVRVLPTQDPLLLLNALDEELPDVLLLDIEMPGCRGPELATIVRQHPNYARIPVIYLTGHESMQDKLLARATAAEDFLTKPVAPELLLTTVKSHARRHRSFLRNEQQTQQQQIRSHMRLEQLRQAIDEHAIVSITDASGNILHINDKFCEISGYERQELLGKNHRMVKSGIHPRDFYDELWQTISSGKPWHGEVCNRCKDGDFYWVEASIIPFTDAQGLPYQYISIRTDITHIKAAEQTLREQETIFRSLFAAVADGIVLHSIDGQIKECNPAAERILGLSRDQLLGRGSSDIRWHCIHPDGRVFPGPEHPAQVTLLTGAAQRDVVMGIYRPNGSLVWVNINTEPMCNPDHEGAVHSVVVSFTDITRSREAEMAACNSLSQLEATIKAIPDLLFEMDDQGYYLDYQGHKDTELLATLADTLAGQNVDQVLPLEAAATVKQALAEAADNGCSYGRQIWLDVPKGHCCFELSVARKNLLGNSDKRHFVLLSRDITERKQAEMALREREQQLQEAQKLAHLGNWSVDLETGEVLWSEEVFRIFGQDPASFTPDRQAFLAAVHPADQANVRESEQKADANGKHDICHRLIRPDGTIRHVRELARSERNTAGQVVRLIGTVQDITEQVEAETRLRETQARFTFAVEGAGDGIWDWNMQTGAISFSGHYESMLGFAKGEIEACISAWIASVHPDDLPGVQQKLQDYLDGKLAAYEVELRLQCKDGSYKWVLCRGNIVEQDEHGQACRMVGIHSDISERKRAEEALLVFRRLVETTDQAIRVSDSSGRIQYVNPAYEKLLGYDATEVIGQPFTRIGTAPEQESLVQEILQKMQLGDGWRGFLKLRDKQGREFISLSNIRSITSPETGELLHSFNMFVDYSEEIARQEALEQAVAEANAANQAKSNFLSSMSHELRTPMNAIIGFAQMLEYDSNLDADQQDNIHEILKASHHLLELINEVLDLAKIESGRINLSLELVGTPLLVDECLQLIQPLARERGIQLDIRMPETAGVRADRVRLKQVLLNLLSNAIKYNREQGRIELCVASNGDRLRITVTDTGIGIPPERLHEVFQPFNRLSAEYSETEGTGIGLTITQRLVHLMGGEIGVESVPDVGSSFWIELPAEDDFFLGDENHPNAETGEMTRQGNEYRVLCIDDNPVNLKLIAQILGMRKHIHLTTAHAPELGIELALALRPDLILLDINMPGMDGYQVLEILKADARLKTIPVFAVTANAMPRDISRGKAAGFTEYLTKPLNIQQFLDSVDLCLKNREECTP